MNCLTDLIGVWDQCSPKEPEVKYINDLPGFNISFADYLTTPEKKTGIDVISGCISNASDELEAELRSFLDPRMRLGSVVNNSIVGFFEDNKKIKPADAGFYGGTQIEIGNSHNLGIFIESITVFSPNSYTSENLYIYDLTQGKVLQTTTFNAVSGEYSTFSVNKLYKSNGQFLNLFICRNADTSYQTDVISGMCHGCGHSWNKNLVDGYVYARSAKLSQSADPIQSSLQSSSHSYGISVKYQLVCDSSNFICSISSRLKMAMFYKTGIAICDEIIYGKRLNSLTTVQKKDAESLKKDYMGKYETAMNLVLNNISMPNDICFQCDPFISVKPSIP